MATPEPGTYWPGAELLLDDSDAEWDFVVPSDNEGDVDAAVSAFEEMEATRIQANLRGLFARRRAAGFAGLALLWHALWVTHVIILSLADPALFYCTYSGPSSSARLGPFPADFDQRAYVACPLPTSSALITTP